MNRSVGDMRKFVISFWFRIPAATVQKARDNLSGFGIFKVYAGVIPLVSWGNQTVGDRGSAGSGPMPPSYIGVRTVDTLAGENRTTLEVHIQTSDVATGDVGDDRKYPDYFGNSEIDAGFLSAGYPDVLVDHWNHVILSCDLHSHSDISCKMWCAINDVNISGGQLAEDNFRGLPAMGTFFAEPNDHCSAAVYATIDTEDVVVSEVSAIPSNPFCVPALSPVDIDDGDFNPVLKVEVAELQVFAGATLDTAITSKRRAFVDPDGYPVPPFGSVDDEGNPVPSPAASAVGKDAEIVLSGSDNWITGYNSGTLGHNADGEQIPSGQFAPTGNILAWFPDPSLHGPQAPAPPPEPPPEPPTRSVRLTRNPALAK